jgi:Zn-finger nucleic acid-binding protein
MLLCVGGSRVPPAQLIASLDRSSCDRFDPGPYAGFVICPKCQASMRTVDKQGVRLEQCEVCRGIFLDHGELEQILHAEQHYYGGGVPRYTGSHGYPDSPRPYRHHPDSPRPYRGGHYPDSPRPYGHRSHGGHGSFLRHLFD